MNAVNIIFILQVILLDLYVNRIVDIKICLLRLFLPKPHHVMEGLGHQNAKSLYPHMVITLRGEEQLAPLA